MLEAPEQVNKASFMALATASCTSLARLAEVFAYKMVWPAIYAADGAEGS